MSEKLYFVDGYHGGVDGHMPVGSWQDILGALERRPDWTVSLDVEPESYEWIKRHDFEVYSKLREFVENPDTAERIEFLNGCYAQPFCWAIDGESVIRQMVRGIGIIKRLFPTAQVDTYSVQEPCFTSQLPQMIKKLGFRCMSLKNSTCWGGYMAKMPGSIVRLHSPDGTWVPAVVRYECEELYDCCATDASGYDRENVKTIADRCVAAGIAAPNGMTYQDLGWLSEPMVSGFPVEFLTYRKYFEKFGHLVNGDVDFHQEDVLCAMPWGTVTLQNSVRAVRHLEYRLPRLEKLMLAAGKNAEIGEETFYKLSRAWDDTMSAQHHDAYICAATPRWVEHVHVKTTEANKLLAEVEDEILAAGALADFAGRAEADEFYLRVYNTTANPARGYVSIRCGLPIGWRDADVFDSRGNKVASIARGVMYSKFGYDENGVLLPGDPVPKPRIYPDGSEEAMDITFEANVEGLGYATYRVCKCEVKKADLTAPPLAKICDNGVSVSNGVWDIFFDSTKGGAVTGLLDISSGIDYAADGEQGYIRGFFPEANRMCTSLENPADIRILSNTHFEARLRICGSINGHGFTTEVCITKGERRIDYKTAVDFEAKPEAVGDPERPPENAPHNWRRRSGYNEEPKLSIAFNVGSGEKQVYKAAPYDVCESRLGENTSFIDWGEIKHNIVNDYVDVCSVNGRGFGLWCDQITGYSLNRGLLTLTMGFGGYVGFFWGDYPLKGTPTMEYSLFAHSGDTFEAHTALAFAGRVEPLTVHRLAGRPGTWDYTAVAAGDADIKATGAIKDGDGWALRLFNASPKDKPFNIRCDFEGCRGVKCDLWGKPSGESADRISKFEIITLK